MAHTKSVLSNDQISLKEEENVNISTKSDIQNKSHQARVRVLPGLVYKIKPPSQVVWCLYFIFYLFCLSLMIPSWIFAFKAYEELTLNNGTKCDSDDIENTLKFYLINHGIFIFFGFLSLFISLFDSKRFKQEEDIIYIPIILIVAVNFYVRLVWYIMFLVAYKQEIPDCLDENDDITFDEAYIYIKIVFIVEAIVTGPVFTIMSLIVLCFPVYVCVGFCMIVQGKNRMLVEDMEECDARNRKINMKKARLVGHTATLFNLAALNAIEEDILPPPLPT